MVVLAAFFSACGSSGDSDKTLPDENVDALDPESSVSGSSVPTVEPEPTPNPVESLEELQVGLVADINKTSKVLSSSPHDFYSVNNKLIFTAWTQETGRTLWVVDNEEAEPHMLNEAASGGANIDASYSDGAAITGGFKNLQGQRTQRPRQNTLRLSALGDIAIFEAARAIWITDASTEGTSKFIDLTASESFAQAYRHGDQLYILSTDRAWRYDTVAADLTTIELQFLPLASHVYVDGSGLNLEDNDKELISLEFDSQTGRFLYLLRSGDEVQLWDYLGGVERQLRSYGEDVFARHRGWPLWGIAVIGGHAFVAADPVELGDSFLEKIDLNSLQVKTLFSDWRVYLAGEASLGNIYVGVQSAIAEESRLYAYDVANNTQRLLMSSDQDAGGLSVMMFDEDLQDTYLSALEYTQDRFQVFSSGETINILINIYSDSMLSFGGCGANPEHSITWYQVSPEQEAPELRSSFDAGCAGFDTGVEPFVSTDGGVAFVIDAYAEGEEQGLNRKISVFDSGGSEFIADDLLLPTVSFRPPPGPAIGWLGNTIFYNRDNTSEVGAEDVGEELYRISTTTGDEQTSNIALEAGVKIGI